MATSVEKTSNNGAKKRKEKPSSPTGDSSGSSSQQPSKKAKSDPVHTSSDTSSFSGSAQSQSASKSSDNGQQAMEDTNDKGDKPLSSIDSSDQRSGVGSLDSASKPSPPQQKPVSRSSEESASSSSDDSLSGYSSVSSASFAKTKPLSQSASKSSDNGQQAMEDIDDEDETSQAAPRAPSAPLSGSSGFLSLSGSLNSPKPSPPQQKPASIMVPQKAGGRDPKKGGKKDQSTGDKKECVEAQTTDSTDSKLVSLRQWLQQPISSSSSNAAMSLSVSSSNSSSNNSYTGSQSMGDAKNTAETLYQEEEFSAQAKKHNKIDPKAQELLQSQIIKRLQVVRISHLQWTEIERDYKILLKITKTQGRRGPPAIKYEVFNLTKGSDWEPRQTSPIDWFDSKKELDNLVRADHSKDNSSHSSRVEDTADKKEDDENEEMSFSTGNKKDKKSKSVPDRGKKKIEDYCGMCADYSPGHPSDHGYPAADIRGNILKVIEQMNSDPNLASEILKDPYSEYLFNKDPKTGQIYGTLLLYKLYHNDESNLETICTDCNTVKSKILPEDWFKAQKILFPNFLDFFPPASRFLIIRRVVPLSGLANDPAEVMGIADAFRHYVGTTQQDSKRLKEIWRSLKKDYLADIDKIPRLIAEGREEEAREIRDTIFQKLGIIEKLTPTCMSIIDRIVADTGGTVSPNTARDTLNEVFTEPSVQDMVIGHAIKKAQQKKANNQQQPSVAQNRPPSPAS